MLDVKHVGGRTHPVTGDQYNAFEITERPTNGRSPWPSGPLFPVGHILFTRDGKAYEVVSSRTIEDEARYSGYLTYIHSYLCREADPMSR